MKRRALLISTVLLGITVFVFAEDIQLFISALDAKWIARDYQGIRQTIESRLTEEPNDLAALAAKANYYGMIELNMLVVSNTVLQIDQIRSSLAWTNNVTNIWMEAALMMMVHNVTNQADAAAGGYIFGATSNQLEELHRESPTNYPISPFLKRLSNVQYGHQ